jgi:hypothetical protein
MEKYSFQRGYNQVQIQYKKAVQRKIMRALKITTPPSWYQRLNGNVEPRISEAKAIEAIFAKYGIKEVWGEGQRIPA